MVIVLAQLNFTEGSVHIRGGFKRFAGQRDPSGDAQGT